MTGRRMQRALTSSAISGVIAAIIYAIISALTNAGATQVIVGAVAIGLFTLVIAFIINVIISSLFARQH
jgi:hypothetical protein